MTASEAEQCWAITGTSRGIGLELTRLHLERGGHVIAIYRDDLPESLYKLMLRYGAKLAPVQFDVRQQRSAQSLRAHIPLRIDALVHGAAIFGPRTTSLWDQDYTAVLETFDINALGMVRVTEALLPFMEGSRHPRIVAMSTLMATQDKAGPGHLAYRLSKAALNMAMHMLASEVAEKGIATACLRPGHVRTRMGGPHGEISAEESAGALLGIIDNLEFHHRAKFIDYTGAELRW